MDKRPRRMQVVRPCQPAAVLVNAGETRSVVGSDNALIAQAMSILHGATGAHPGRVTIDQARDVLRWAGAL